jgi:hypothetical protein
VTIQRARIGLSAVAPARAAALGNTKTTIRLIVDWRTQMRVGRLGARRIGRAVNLARIKLTALRANDPERSVIVHFWQLTWLIRASLVLFGAYLGPLWRARDDLRAQGRTHRRVAENFERKKPQMNTDGTGKPDVTRVPIPSGSTEEGPGGADRNVEMSKRSGDPDSIGVEIRGWE